MIEPDIGNLHVIDWYLYQALRDWKERSVPETSPDFDLTTEQREGWAYE